MEQNDGRPVKPADGTNIHRYGVLFAIVQTAVDNIITKRGMVIDPVKRDTIITNKLISAANKKTKEV